jgi:hypothetical protein
MLPALENASLASSEPPSDKLSLLHDERKRRRGDGPRRGCNDSQQSNHAPRFEQGVKRRQHTSQPMHSSRRISAGLLNLAQTQE